MSLTRDTWLSALKEFDHLDHDWLTVEYTSNSSSSERKRQSAFKYLADRGFVEEKNARNFADGVGFPQGANGELVHSEIVYRITADGRDFLERQSFAERSWLNLKHLSVKARLAFFTLVSLFIALAGFFLQAPSDSGLCIMIGETSYFGEFIKWMGGCLKLGQ